MPWIVFDPNALYCIKVEGSNGVTYWGPYSWHDAVLVYDALTHYCLSAVIFRLEACEF